MPAVAVNVNCPVPTSQIELAVSVPCGIGANAWSLPNAKYWVPVVRLVGVKLAFGGKCRWTGTGLGGGIFCPYGTVIEAYLGMMPLLKLAAASPLLYWPTARLLPPETASVTRHLLFTVNVASKAFGTVPSISVIL